MHAAATKTCKRKEDPKRIKVSNAIRLFGAAVAVICRDKSPNKLKVCARDKGKERKEERKRKEGKGEREEGRGRGMGTRWPCAHGI